MTVLCFVRESERAIGEIARVPKPGGRMVLGELGATRVGPLGDVFVVGSVM